MYDEDYWWAFLYRHKLAPRDQLSSPSDRMRAGIVLNYDDGGQRLDEDIMRPRL